MDEQKDSSEGAQPPSEQKQVRRRRIRKLSGPAAQALGELAFAMYAVCDSSVPDVHKWSLLKAKLLAWRAAFLP